MLMHAGACTSFSYHNTFATTLFIEQAACCLCRPAVHALMLLEQASALMQRCPPLAALRAKVTAQLAAALAAALQSPQLAPWVLPAAGGAVAFAVAELGPSQPPLLSEAAATEGTGSEVS